MSKIDIDKLKQMLADEEDRQTPLTKQKKTSQPEPIQEENPIEEKVKVKRPMTEKKLEQFKKMQEARKTNIEAKRKRNN
jgi:hypothetical protein